jgi:hypothetical protein
MKDHTIPNLIRLPRHPAPVSKNAVFHVIVGQ